MKIGTNFICKQNQKEKGRKFNRKAIKFWTVHKV